MTIVTRHALRVYAALAGLKRDSGGDVLDALIPFMEPVLELMHGKVFDPGLLSVGVQRLYSWRFNRDVAEQFAGRLLTKGYLRRATPARNVLIVDFKPRSPADDGQVEIAAILDRVIDEFESFPPKVTDLFRFSLSRDDLKDVLIRFLVSLDAYTEEAFAEQVERMKLDLDKKTLLDQLDEGGQPLTSENRYLCARFVTHLVKEKPEFVPHLARLASIGLLTEVVEDFIKPTAPATKSDLVLVLDAPVALTLLGLSGREAREDIEAVVNSLRAIGCGFIVLPVSCEEMSRNLSSMLALTPSDRHGPTHDAMRKGEVAEDYVRSVLNNPEKALDKVGVTVRPVDLDTFPSGVRFFDAPTYEDFLAGITWKHGSIDAREHDATCTALTMRLRAGVKNSDPLASKFAFVTTNPIFVRYARDFCRRSRLINERQTPPVILQRELAVTAWLRTGLSGPAGDDFRKEIPRGHLIASCERVLRPRKEVVRAVHEKLREFAPEKTAQYELMLADHRSVQRLMDETLGDERLVTAENADKLLEEMRLATAQEIKEKSDRKLRQQAQKHGAQTRALREEADALMRAERDSAEAALQAKQREVEAREAQLASLHEERDRFHEAAKALQAREIDQVTALMTRVNVTTRRVEVSMLAIVWAVVGLVVFGTTLGQNPNHNLFWGAGVAFALLGAYHTVQELRQKPKFGFENILNWLARRKLHRGLHVLGLNRERYSAALKREYGRLRWDEAARDRLTDLPKQANTKLLGCPDRNEAEAA